MNNSEIIFKDLRKLSKSLNKGNDTELVDYFNTFKGDDVFQKFKNILLVWESDVSPSLNLNIDNKSTKIALSYINSIIPQALSQEIFLKVDDFDLVVDIPKYFDNLVQETLPIYSLIQYINISGISINLIDLPIEERKSIIDNLPARVYNALLHKILECKSRILSFDNPSLDKFKFNFLTNEPYLFLKGLFNNFGDDYYKDVIYHLSKRIDGDLLVTSTPSEIEYYIQKYSEEMKNQNDGLTS